MNTILLSILGLAHAADPQQIIEESIAKQQIENSIQTLTMTLYAKNDTQQIRQMEIHVRKDSDVLRSYTRFTAPSEIEGTQLLFVDHPNQEDPQLLYLPALKRIQRISGAKKNGSFLGSDFRFSDLELSLNGTETHTLESETDTHWIIRTVDPKEKNYSSWRTTISKADYLPYTIEYYSKNGSLYKTFSVEKTMTVDTHTIPQTTWMKNHQKGTKTRLHIENIEINLTPERLPLSRFSPEQLESND